MAWIKTVDETEAGGLLSEIYEQVSRERGKIANIIRVHSLNPSAMKAHLDLYMAVMFGESGLSRPEREMIAVVVSAANRCEYCVNHHAEALNYYWKNSDNLQMLIEDFDSLDLPERQHKMLEYALKLTLTPGEVEETDVNALRESGLSDEHILNINLIVSYFNFVNRIASGLGVEFTPEEAAGYEY